jgi:hypothetical protein
MDDMMGKDGGHESVEQKSGFDDMMGKDERHESVSAYLAAVGNWEVKSYPAVGKVQSLCVL